VFEPDGGFASRRSARTTGARFGPVLPRARSNVRRKRPGPCRDCGMRKDCGPFPISAMNVTRGPCSGCASHSDPLSRSRGRRFLLF